MIKLDLSDEQPCVLGSGKEPSNFFNWPTILWMWGFVPFCHGYCALSFSFPFTMFKLHHISLITHKAHIIIHNKEY